jgi:hypothetical protein
MGGTSVVRRRTVAALLGLLGCASAPIASDAALPSAPLTVSVAVSPGTSDYTIAVSIELPPDHAVDATAPFDLSVLQVRGFQDAVFLAGRRLRAAPRSAPSAL